MATLGTNTPHSIGWVDLATTDLAGSREFYAGLFGWNYFNDDGHPYWMCMLGEDPVAGMMELTPEMGDMPPVWSVYVVVEDADATIAAATAAGGSVFQPPFEVDDGQRIAVIADPVGSAICLFEGIQDNGMKRYDEVGAPCWYDCRSRDVPASRDFCTTVFGWTAETMDMGVPYTVFAHNGTPICGLVEMPEEIPAEVPSFWAVNFVVADADQAAVFTREHGGLITYPPMDTPFGRACGITDPGGAFLTIIDRSQATV